MYYNSIYILHIYQCVGRRSGRHCAGYAKRYRGGGRAARAASVRDTEGGKWGTSPGGEGYGGGGHTPVCKGIWMGGHTPLRVNPQSVVQ